MSFKNIVYLDMDGVLCDFDLQMEKYNAWRTDVHKVQWGKLDKIGEKFWEEMDPIENGIKLYRSLLKISDVFNFEIKILSAVHLLSGKNGKIKWLHKYCPEIKDENIFILNKGSEKYKFADSLSILVDDNEQNCTMFSNAGGYSINYNQDNISTIKKIIDYYERI